MEFADLGLEVTVVYEDLSDVWPVISQVRQITHFSCTSPSSFIFLLIIFFVHHPLQALEAQLPLRQVSLINKLGATVYVDQMPLQ